MDDKTWVKLYRKSLSNDVRRHDPTAWRLFETLLLLVDSKTGKWSGGIYQLTEADGYLNSNTIYKALIRLSKKGMITKTSNTRYSDIYICNFLDYHQPGNSSSKNTGETQAKPSNTLTRSKNKEVRNIYKTKRDVLGIVNRVAGRSFKVEPRGIEQTKSQFTDKEIEQALNNMLGDEWHKSRVSQLSSDYLLRASTIDKFKDFKAVSDKKPIGQIYRTAKEQGMPDLS